MMKDTDREDTNVAEYDLPGVHRFITYLEQFSIHRRAWTIRGDSCVEITGTAKGVSWGG